MNRIAIVVAMTAITVNAASAYVTDIGSTTGIDLNTHSELSRSTRSVQLNNYARGTMQTVQVRSNGRGGYDSGMYFDYSSDTPEMFRIEVDSKGNTTRWNY